MNIKVIILFLFSFFIFLRIIILENDLPPRVITDIYAVDELYYTIPAFNLYNYNKFSYQEQLPFKTKNDAGAGNTLQNITTYFTLLIFGNNYYGLRMASVIISLFSILLLFLIFRKIDQENLKLALFLLFYFGIEFSFLIASRSNAPVNFRIFSLVLILYIVFLIKDYMKLSFMLGLLSTISIFFVYFHNLFIWAASLFSIIIYSYLNKKSTDKKIYINIILFFLGTIMSVVLFNMFIKAAYNIDIIDYFNGFKVYSRRLAFDSNENFLLASGKNMLNFFTTSIFRLNISFLFISLLIFPSFIYKIIKEKRFIDVFILLLLLMLFGQSIFENSFHFRRLTIILPIALLVIYNGVIYLKIFKDFLKVKNYFKYYKIYFYIIILFSIFIFYMSNISKYSYGSIGHTLFNIGEFFVIINIIMLIIISIVSYIYFFEKKDISLKVFTYIYLLLLIPNFYLSLRYITPKFNYKETMIHFSRNLKNNEITVGQASFLFRLYNNSKPILNWYKYEKIDDNAYKNNFKKAFKEKNIKYTIDFYKKNKPFQLNDLVDNNLKLKLVKSYLIDKVTIVVLLKKIED